jgi:hypothetical protein
MYIVIWYLWCKTKPIHLDTSERFSTQVCVLIFFLPTDNWTADRIFSDLINCRSSKKINRNSEGDPCCDLFNTQKIDFGTLEDYFTVKNALENMETEKENKATPHALTSFPLRNLFLVQEQQRLLEGSIHVQRRDKVLNLWSALRCAESLISRTRTHTRIDLPVVCSLSSPYARRHHQSDELVWFCIREIPNHNVHGTVYIC